MGGLTDNTDLLAATNQLIKAVNDLADKVSPTDVGLIADAITAQTTMLETRSVAETTAQNTNFANLIQSVDNVQLSVNLSGLISAIQSCCTNVNNNLGLIVGAIRAIRLVTTGGGGGGITGAPYLDPPAIVPEPGGSIPGGVNLEKCQAANYVYWAIVSTLRRISSIQYVLSQIADETTLASIVTGLLVVSTVVAVGTAGLEAIIAGIVGLILSAGNEAILLYFNFLADSLEEDKQDIICNLYEAQDANQARDYIHSLIDSKIDAVAAIPLEVVWGPLGFPLALLKYTLAQVAKTIAGNYLVNVLFDPDATVQATEIPDALECDVCGCTIRFEFVEGLEGWESFPGNEGNSVVQSWSGNEALRTEISISIGGVGGSGNWRYFPASHNQEWVVSTGDVFEARENCTAHPNNGAGIFMFFTDETSFGWMGDVGDGGATLSITVPEEHNGKTIDYLEVNYHLGTAASPGSSSIAEWEYAQLSLQAGGC